MGTVIAWILSIATILGGFAALVYFRDKWRGKQQWNEQKKEVNSAWWESSELKKHYEARSYQDFRWSDPDRVAERVAQGKEVLYELDEKQRIKYKLVNKSGQVLMGRKGA